MSPRVDSPSLAPFLLASALIAGLTLLVAGCSALPRGSPGLVRAVRVGSAAVSGTDALGPPGRRGAGGSGLGGEPWPASPARAEAPPSRLVVEAFQVPLLWVGADEDDGEPGGGVELDAELERGAGYGFEVGWRGDDAGFGVLRLDGEHTDVATGLPVRSRATLLEARLHGDAPRAWGGWQAMLGLGAGFGGLDFEAGPDDSHGTALSLRATAGARIGEHVGLELGGGYYEWGLPGETIGHAAYVSLGLTLHL